MTQLRNNYQLLLKLNQKIFNKINSKNIALEINESWALTLYQQNSPTLCPTLTFAPQKNQTNKQTNI